jgi:hypothetical protein
MRSMWLNCTFGKYVVFMDCHYQLFLIGTLGSFSHFWRCLWRLSNTKIDFSGAYHPLIDGKTEVVNCSMGDLLWSLVGDHLKLWD